MIVTIETYRGFEIYFNTDTDTEKFSTIPSEENSKESKSFAACKQAIDEYLKNNQTFNPFVVRVKPESYGSPSDKKIKIIGIRKDNRFIIENESGEKEQFSSYNEDRYILDYPENNYLFEEYKKSIDLEEGVRKEQLKVRKELISKMKIKTLSDYKKEL